MEKTYTSKPYRIILNLVYGIFAAGVVGILVGYVSDKVSYATVAAILIFLAYLWLVIIKNLITITISKTHLTVKKGNKESFFELAQCNFRAKTITRSWDTECKLYVTDSEGKEHFIDCELIGIGQFEELLEDLGMLGDTAPVQKLDTQTK